MLTLSIQLKTDLVDGNFPPQETAHWIPVLQASAMAIQQLNVLFADQLIHGPLKSNPEATQIEGYLGDVNTPPNEFGVMTIVLENYAALKIPYLPPEVPFSLYLGDTSEKKEVGTDEEGNPIYETVYAGVIQ